MFASDASNLVHGDTNERRDIFRRDRASGRTYRLSVATSGVQGNATSGNPLQEPAISADGDVTAFSGLAGNLVAGDTNDRADVFVRDTMDMTTTRVSATSGDRQANGSSRGPSIAGGGRVVAFSLAATDLVGGDGDAHVDVFVHDR